MPITFCIAYSKRRQTKELTIEVFAEECIYVHEWKTYLKNVNQNHQVIVFKIDLVFWADCIRHSFDDDIPVEIRIVPYSGTDSVLSQKEISAMWPTSAKFDPGFARDIVLNCHESCIGGSRLTFFGPFPSWK